MTRRTLTTLVLVALGVIIGLRWYRPDRTVVPSSAPTAPLQQATSRPSTAGVPGVPVTGANPGRPAIAPPVNPALTEARITLADELNASGGTVQRDLRILEDILDAWRSNFPHDGNPVGENSEITAVLTGENALNLALIPKGHRALNGEGELCDRWGTPFRFHQLSGEKMEIRSAGADRKFGTADDAVFTP